MTRTPSAGWREVYRWCGVDPLDQLEERTGDR